MLSAVGAFCEVPDFRERNTALFVGMGDEILPRDSFYGLFYALRLYAYVSLDSECAAAPGQRKSIVIEGEKKSELGLQNREYGNSYYWSKIPPAVCVHISLT